MMDDTFLEMEVDVHVNGQAIPRNIAEFELNQLSAAFLQEHVTFARLRDRYKVNIPLLLSLLARHRIEWLLANETPLFTNWSLQEVENMPKTLLQLSQAMERAWAFLTDYERFRWHLNHSNEEAQPDQAQPRRENSQYFVRNVRTDDLEVRLRSQEDLGVAAVGVRLWARHLEGVNWRTLTDRTGKLRFGRGAPAKLGIEARAGHDLVAFMRRETTRSLYEDVGTLLIATFPSLKSWRHRGGKELRNSVKQLLSRYPT